MNAEQPLVLRYKNAQDTQAAHATPDQTPCDLERVLKRLSTWARLTAVVVVIFAIPLVAAEIFIRFCLQ